MGGEPGPTGGDEVQPALDDAFRDALAELDDYLEGMSDEQLSELVLPLASRWVLPDVGLDLARLREEADTFVQATPEWERVLLNYPKRLAYWVAQRMLVDAEDEPRPDRAAAQLATARAELERRTELLEAEGFYRVASGFRRLLEETAGGSPPTDPLWNALALRIAESVLD